MASNSPNDNDPQAAALAGRKQPFTLYAANGRIYARNADQKVIDLGALTQQDGGRVSYLLDGNQMSGEGLADEMAALRHIAAHVRYLWLDGQFTAVADAREDPALNLDGAAELEITLDELKPGERVYDATV
jgi:hypothetical protein